jgi:small subunit ribosomal protein S9
VSDETAMTEEPVDGDAPAEVAGPSESSAEVAGSSGGPDAPLSQDELRAALAEAPVATAADGSEGPPTAPRRSLSGKSLGTGRRKEAVARVRVVPGTGRFELNGRPLEDYFPTRAHRMQVTAPLRLVGHEKDVDVIARLHGGGTSGQAGALSLGIARALIDLDESFRPTLKAEGMLRRDPREKERRKYGLKKARKAPQYSKR